jgi:Phosphotransferase enzyme family
MLTLEAADGEDRFFTTGQSWLAAAIPASARRFRVHDSDLLATLQAAGAQITEHRPDVEIGPARSIRGDARVAIALPPSRPRDSASGLGRALGRIRQSIAIRIWLVQARRAVARAGYRTTKTLLFDVEQSVRLEGDAPPPRLSARFPRDGALIAHNGTAEPSLLEIVLEEVATATGRRVASVAPTLRAGVLLVSTDGGYLRLAVGSANRQVRNQASVLDDLHTRDLPSEVKALVPRILSRGRTGLGEWTFETKLPGAPSGHVLDDEILADAVSFLVDLAGPLGIDPTPWLAVSSAESVAALVGGAEERAMLRIAEVTRDRLRDVPRVFGHGDFCSNNLLVRDGRLSGVVDWEGAGAGRLPLLDLYHLLMLHHCQPGVYEWGPAIVSYLVPLGRSGDDPHLQRYVAAKGFQFTAGTLQDLVCAYWLSRISYQLSSFAMRRTDRTWIRRNVTVPANALLETL